jgi:hypothetical protein
MKFKVKPTISVFGVGTVEYHPGDVVEGPDEWVETNSHILEPILEPKPITTIQAITDAVAPEEALKILSNSHIRSKKRMSQKTDMQLLIEGLRNAELFKFLFDRMLAMVILHF